MYENVSDIVLQMLQGQGVTPAQAPDIPDRGAEMDDLDAQRAAIIESLTGEPANPEPLGAARGIGAALSGALGTFAAIRSRRPDPRIFERLLARRRSEFDRDQSRKTAKDKINLADVEKQRDRVAAAMTQDERFQQAEGAAAGRENRKAQRDLGREARGNVQRGKERKEDFENQQALLQQRIDAAKPQDNDVVSKEFSTDTMQQVEDAYLALQELSVSGDEKTLAAERQRVIRLISARLRNPRLTSDTVAYLWEIKDELEADGSIAAEGAADTTDGAATRTGSLAALAANPNRRPIGGPGVLDEGDITGLGLPIRSGDGLNETLHNLLKSIGATQ